MDTQWQPHGRGPHCLSGIPARPAIQLTRGAQSSQEVPQEISTALWLSSAEAEVFFSKALEQLNIIDHVYGIDGFEWRYFQTAVVNGFLDYGCKSSNGRRCGENGGLLRAEERTERSRRLAIGELKTLQFATFVLVENDFVDSTVFVPVCPNAPTHH